VVAEQLALETSPLEWRPDVANDMAVIEAALASASLANDQSLSVIAGHLVAAGGQRLRPALVAASGLVGTLGTSALSSRLVRASVSVELVHLGTLYHDDVIDKATTRDGVETVNHRWGDLKAILAGDFLLARASELAATLSTEIAEILAETIGWVCEGQARELNDVHNADRTESDYFETIRNKTAALFATACRIGGLVAGLDRGDVSRLTEFGRAYGFAYQILDDVGDFTMRVVRGAKETGGDLRSGVFTLPVIRHLATQSGAVLRGDIGQSAGDAALDKAANEIAESPVLDGCIESAKEYAREAAELISGLNAGPATEGLRTAAEKLSLRTSRRPG